MTGTEEEKEIRSRKKEKDFSNECVGKTRDSSKQHTEDGVTPKYGPLPTFPNQRIWARLMLIVGTLIIVYFTSSNEVVTILAKQKEQVDYRRQNVPCTPEYIADLNLSPDGCKVERCGLIVRDRLLTEGQAKRLLALTHRIFTAGSTLGSHFNVPIEKLNSTSFYRPEEAKLIIGVVKKLRETIGPGEGSALKLMEPSQFNRITPEAPKPYKERCKWCHFNAIVFLNNYNDDFEGGRSVFIQSDNSSIIIEPKAGRVLSWNGAGSYGVEAVKSGVCHTLRLSYACYKII